MGYRQDELGLDWGSFFRDLKNPSVWADNIAKETERTVRRIDSGRSAFQQIADFFERGRNVVTGAGAGAQAGASTPVGENRAIWIGGAAVLGLLLLTRGKR